MNRTESTDSADVVAQLPDLPDTEIHHRHRDVSGGWLRPTVFGMMDGLVSNFALVAGLAGASASTSQITLAGWAGLVGGAFSMAAGEYISVRSQNESTAAEVAVERNEIINNAAAEQAELAQMYVDRGVDRDLADKVAEQLSRDPDQAVLVHAREELGIDPKQLPAPGIAAVSSLSAFSVGAFLPLLPYLLGASTLLVSLVLAVVALFAAGSVTSRFTIRTWWFGGVRQLLFGLVAAAVTFGVGALFGATAG